MAEYLAGRIDDEDARVVVVVDIFVAKAILLFVIVRWHDEDVAAANIADETMAA